jgi:hypothetical protein
MIMKCIKGLAPKSLVVLLGCALIFPGAADAATKPTNLKVFKNGTSTGFNVTSRGWSDLNFVGQGWTHNSQFGQFKARKGQTVTIKVISANPGIHPGLTVWYRPSNSSGNHRKGLGYVPAHNYPQTSDWNQNNARDEETQKRLGNIVMKYIANGYDADGNDPSIDVRTQVNNPMVVALVDNIPGIVQLQFTAPKKGIYQFATGGINPYPGNYPSSSSKLPVTVIVTMSKP